MNTKAALLFQPNTPLRVEEVTLDDPQDHEVMVKVAASGVCHTDLHFIEGTVPIGMPVVVGHEGAGIVERVGPNVSGLEPGDHVIITATTSCGECHFCIEGHPARCLTKLMTSLSGTLLAGGRRLRIGEQEVNHLFGLATFAEHTVVHERSCVKIRQDAPLDVMCLLACGAVTGIGSVVNDAGVKPGETITVWGAGGVGLAAIMGAKLCGAGKTISIDIMDHKLNVAKELGADFVINASECDPVAKIRELTRIGADAAVICATGGVNIIEQALLSLRLGGRCVIVGASFGEKTSVPLNSLVRGKTLSGSMFGDIRAEIDLPRYADMFMEGKLPIDRLISKRYRLEEINDAFDAMTKGDVIRALICM